MESRSAPANSFSLYTNARYVTQLLRSKLQRAPSDCAELHAALDVIEALWQELRSQSEAVKAERERYAEFFEYAPQAHVVTEAGGEIREANRSARELLGMDDEALERSSLVSFVKEEERPDFRGCLLAARHAYGEAQWSGTLVTRDGREVSATLRSRPVKMRAANAEGLCWLIQPSGL